MVNKGNDPQMALIQVCEILYFSQMNAIAATMATPGPWSRVVVLCTTRWRKKTVVELTLLGYLDIKHVINYNIYLDMLDIRHIGYVGY